MSYLRTNGTASGRVCGWGDRACADVTVAYTLGDEPAPATVTPPPAATTSTLSQGVVIAVGAVVLLLLTNRPRRR